MSHWCTALILESQRCNRINQEWRAHHAVWSGAYLRLRLLGVHRRRADAFSVLSCFGLQTSSSGQPKHRFCLMSCCVPLLPACRKPIESDRLIVYCQPLPREAHPLPAAKVLVSLVPYQLEKISSTTAELAMQS